MKKLLPLILTVLLPGLALAAPDFVVVSSNTATADSQKMLCGNGKRGYVGSVAITNSSAGTVTLYNSSWTITGVDSIGPINTGTVWEFGYNVKFSKGLLYDKSGTAGIQILYNCY